MTKTKNNFIFLFPVAILCIPFVGNFVSEEFNWTFSDFLIGGILLFATAGLIRLILNKSSSKKKKILYSILVLLILLIIWAEMAVGLFGSPIAGS